MYIQVPDVRGYLGKEGDRIVFGAMSVFKCEGPPHTDRLWGLIPKRLLPTFDCWLSCTWLPRWLSDEESTCQGKRLRRHGFDPWVGKILWSRKRQSIQYSCQEIPWTEELAGDRMCGRKESDTTDGLSTQAHSPTLSPEVSWVTNTFYGFSWT